MKDKWSLAQQKFTGMPASAFVSSFYDEAFKYGDETIFWGYVGTNTESLRIL
jgi:hypothetical protein